VSEDRYLESQRRIEVDLASGWHGWSDERAAYLRGHTLAVLATGKRDGSPQLTMIGYVLDDDGALLISAKRYTAKHRNVVRQPKVALIVHDRAKQLVIYGEAEGIEDDPRRADLSVKIFGPIFGKAVSDPAELMPTLLKEQRTVIRVTPTAAFYQE
jgi:PPOX class probable F420-dependent enzyme